MSGDAKTGAERRELRGSAERERIDEIDLLARRELHEAGLVEVVVEAVGLGIDADDFLGQEVLCEGVEICLGLDDIEVRQNRCLDGPLSVP